jgi:type IV pilus assembly protein PilB
MSGMDISERRKPQDGRCRLRFDGRRIDLRVSTMPPPFGEKVVIRLLNTDRLVTPLADIGFSPENVRQVKTFLSWNWKASTSWSRRMAMLAWKWPDASGRP